MLKSLKVTALIALLTFHALYTFEVTRFIKVFEFWFGFLLFFVFPGFLLLQILPVREKPILSKAVFSLGLGLVIQTIIIEIIQLFGLRLNITATVQFLLVLILTIANIAFILFKPSIEDAGVWNIKTWLKTEGLLSLLELFVPIILYVILIRTGPIAGIDTDTWGHVYQIRYTALTGDIGFTDPYLGRRADNLSGFPFHWNTLLASLQIFSGLNTLDLWWFTSAMMPVFLVLSVWTLGLEFTKKRTWAILVMPLAILFHFRLMKMGAYYSIPSNILLWLSLKCFFIDMTSPKKGIVYLIASSLFASIIIPIHMVEYLFIWVAIVPFVLVLFFNYKSLYPIKRLILFVVICGAISFPWLLGIYGDRLVNLVSTGTAFHGNPVPKEELSKVVNVTVEQYALLIEDNYSISDPSQTLRLMGSASFIPILVLVVFLRKKITFEKFVFLLCMMVAPLFVLFTPLISGTLVRVLSYAITRVDFLILSAYAITVAIFISSSYELLMCKKWICKIVNASLIGLMLLVLYPDIQFRFSDRIYFYPNQSIFGLLYDNAGDNPFAIRKAFNFMEATFEKDSVVLTDPLTGWLVPAGSDSVVISKTHADPYMFSPTLKRKNDVLGFLSNPSARLDVLTKYGVSYVVINRDREDFAQVKALYNSVWYNSTLEATLDNSPLFEQIYFERGVSIYKYALPKNTYYSFYENFKQASISTQCKFSDCVTSRMIMVADEERPVLFEHAPSEISFKNISIRPQTIMNFTIGIDQGAWINTDGVNFRIVVDSNGVRKEMFSRLVTPKTVTDDRGWLDMGIDLGEYANQTVNISLITTQSSTNDYDWAGWYDPILISTSE